MQSLSKSQRRCLQKQKNSKINIPFQRNLNSQNNLKKNEAEGLTLPDFKKHDKAIILKIVQYWLMIDVFTSGAQ